MKHALPVPSQEWDWTAYKLDRDDGVQINLKCYEDESGWRWEFHMHNCSAGRMVDYSRAFYTRAGANKAGDSAVRAYVRKGACGKIIDVIKRTEPAR
jgi:hypothetical protein